MLYRYQKGGGGVIAREIVASRVQAPPAFCTEAKVAKGGGVFAGHYGNSFVTSCYVYSHGTTYLSFCSLSLSDNKISADGVLVLAEALIVNRNLKLE